MYKFKEGHKIHIKKANRGKFTDYCGGQVTNECILRGKNSSNPAVRKRATFAANARKWKHKKGGVILKYLTSGSLPKLVDAEERLNKDKITELPSSISSVKPIVPRRIYLDGLTEESWERIMDDFIHTYPDLKNDKYVNEFFLYDVAPRFKRENNDSLYNSAISNILSDTPIYSYPGDLLSGAFTHSPSRLVYDSATKRIINKVFNPEDSERIEYNDKYRLSRPVLVHELTHAYRLGALGTSGNARYGSHEYEMRALRGNRIGSEYMGSGYSDKEKDLLNDTYDMTGYKYRANHLYEKGTTNAEVRYRLWRELYDKLGRRPTIQETDKFINSYDNNKLSEMFYRANGYGAQMVRNELDPEAAKKALIHVAQNETPNNGISVNDEVNYAKRGGKIWLR